MEIRPEYSLEGLILKLKFQYFGHLIWRAIFICSRKDWGQEEKGMTENEMVGWHHQCNGHEFEQSSEVSDGHGSLACCSPWGHKELYMTEQLNWTELIKIYLIIYFQSVIVLYRALLSHILKSEGKMYYHRVKLFSWNSHLHNSKEFCL